MVYLDQGDIKKARDTYKKARDLDGRYRQTKQGANRQVDKGSRRS